jgi:phenylacetate-CoA ligase
MKELSVRQWLPREKLLSDCDELTRKVAAHAAAHVPYYKNLFRDLNIDPTVMRIPEEWQRIPLLDKETLQQQHENLVSCSPHASKFRVNHSGGSTGTPVKFLSDLSLYTKMAGWMDFVATWAGWKPGELRLDLWGNASRSLPPTLRQQARAYLSGNFAIGVHHYGEGDLHRWWQTLCILRPTIIYGYASVLSDFAKWIESEGHRPSGIKGVFSSAEVLYLEQRQIIETSFGCKVFNQYGSRETPCVACECPEGGMHLFVDWNRVEFLDVERGSSESKELVITPLSSYSQPLLRYRIGDLGRPRSGECPCGRGYPLIDIDIARTRDFLWCEDGSKIFPGLVVRLMDGRDWVRAFQFVQKSPTDIVLNIAPNTTEAPTRLAMDLQQELEATLRQRMGANLTLEVCVVDAIDRTRAGKHRYVINEIQSRNGS